MCKLFSSYSVPCFPYPGLLALAAKTISNRVRQFRQFWSIVMVEHNVWESHYDTREFELSPSLRNSLFPASTPTTDVTLA
jgi:hypothetical protein